MYKYMKKDQIVKHFNTSTDEELKKDFLKLRETNVTDLFSRVGSKVVNKYTLKERLDTKGNKGVTFFEVYKNRKELAKKDYIKNILKYYGVDYTDDINTWKNISTLYFGIPHIFRPIIAMNIYHKYKPRVVMDMTMGWGGRLVGACALNIEKYIGIDNNLKLEKPYDKLTKFLAPLCDTEIELYFGDALKFDYSKHSYDLVLTSPPYYNIEVYHNQKERSKEEWDNDFYTPLITKSYAGLQKGGYYCLNIPVEVFERVAKKLLGTPNKKIPLTKTTRTQKHSTEKDYVEYIYIWKK